MKTLILTAIAALTISVGAAHADVAWPSDRNADRAAPEAQENRMADAGAPMSHSYAVSGILSHGRSDASADIQSQAHDFWQNFGLNGGGG